MKTITLHRYLGKPSVDVLVDDEDYPRLSRIKWWKNFHGYIVGRLGGKEVYMHRVIMGEPNGKVIDHINGNKQDNRKCNLRACDIRDNIRNSKVSRNNKSGYPGVSYRPDLKKWRAYIMVNRKQIPLGIYNTKEEAIQARRDGEKKHFGEFAPNH